MTAVVGLAPCHGRDMSPGIARMVGEVAFVVREQTAECLGMCHRMELECQRTFADEASEYLPA